jgi:hypothetical protein
LKTRVLVDLAVEEASRGVLGLLDEEDGDLKKLVGGGGTHYPRLAVVSRTRRIGLETEEVVDLPLDLSAREEIQVRAEAPDGG